MKEIAIAMFVLLGGPILIVLGLLKFADFYYARKIENTPVSDEWHRFERERKVAQTSLYHFEIAIKDALAKQKAMSLYLPSPDYELAKKVYEEAQRKLLNAKALYQEDFRLMMLHAPRDQPLNLEIRGLYPADEVVQRICGDLLLNK